MSATFCCCLIATILSTSLRAAEPPAPKLPEGYVIVPTSISSVRKFGVMAFDDTTNPLPSVIEQNKLIDLQTGRVVATIRGWPAMINMNHGGILPARWSNDDSLLLWQVDGKWSPDTIALVQLSNGSLKSQTDLLTAAQQKLLALTRKAAPKEFAAAKQANVGNGAAYPEGFTVDVEVSGSISFPLHLRAILTSDPKAPLSAQLRSYLDALVDQDGRFRVTHFQLGHAYSQHFG